MVQNKKNFSSSTKMNEGKSLDKKGQARTSDRVADKSVDSSRSGTMRDQAAGQSRKADVSKRDIGSRK